MCLLRAQTATTLCPSEPQPVPKKAAMSQALAKLDASIEAQQVRLAQLKAQKQKLEALAKTKLQGLARKQDTRRKVLLGAMLLERMERDPQVKQQFMDQLASFLTRRDDRLLFGLPASALPEA